jgi:hypothetical protein
MFPPRMLPSKPTVRTAVALALFAALIFAIPAGSASAQSCLDPDADGVLWQIGEQGNGAAEFPANDSWVPVAEYTATGIDTAPDFPGYLSLVPMSVVLTDLGQTPPFSLPLTDAAEQVVISWEQCTGLYLTIDYGRFGSETNLIVLDGEVVPGLVPPGESVDAGLTSEPLIVPKGDHTLSISYIGGGEDNGNYIDFIRAQLVPCDVPDGDAVPDGYTYLTSRRSPQTLTVDVPEGEWDLVAYVGEFNCSFYPGTVQIDGYASVPTPGEPGEDGVVPVTIGTAVGPDTLDFTISTQDRISVGVKIEVQAP